MPGRLTKAGKRFHAADYEQIRAFARAGVSHNRIAAFMGCTQQHVSRIISGAPGAPGVPPARKSLTATPGAQ